MPPASSGVDRPEAGAGGPAHVLGSVARRGADALLPGRSAGGGKAGKECAELEASASRSSWNGSAVLLLGEGMCAEPVRRAGWPESGSGNGSGSGCGSRSGSRSGSRGSGRRGVELDRLSRGDAGVEMAVGEEEETLVPVGCPRREEMAGEGRAVGCRLVLGGGRAGTGRSGASPTPPGRWLLKLSTAPASASRAYGSRHRRTVFLYPTRPLSPSPLPPQSSIAHCKQANISHCLPFRLMVESRSSRQAIRVEEKSGDVIKVTKKNRSQHKIGSARRPSVCF